MTPFLRTRTRPSRYERRPFVATGDAAECALGWDAIAARIALAGGRVVVVETYQGVHDDDVRRLARALGAALHVRSEEALLPPAAIDAMLASDLTDDPVFGRLTCRALDELFDAGALAALRRRVEGAAGRIVVSGPGASLVARGDVVVYADLARWEIQQRQRHGGLANLGADNGGVRASEKYKRSYFVDWRLLDRHKVALFDRIDFFLDTTGRERPKLIAADAVWRGLRRAATRPFRVVPFFDPAPWGGQWMRSVCALPDGPPNYGWCFDCVPEENALLLGFGSERVELPALDLVLRHPDELLGARVRERFGAEFPIRFDFLDTVRGGNLSFQVHPVTAYMRAQFGVPYTQDESYYILDADQQASVYLGLVTGTQPEQLMGALHRAQDEGIPFPADTCVNRWPARRHDHFLIPAGTPHGAGAGCLVLEISATPYVFTFKLWDWGRLGLDGRPRPIHLEHGARNIRYERDTDFVRRELVNRITPLGHGDGWRAERTGLHAAEFIETHRHWFTRAVPHDTHDGVNVLNLVQGEQAVVESPDRAFDPVVVHYAETFVVPAAVGPYRIRPSGPEGGAEHATIKAFVRGPGQRPSPEV